MDMRLKKVEKIVKLYFEQVAVVQAWVLALRKVL